MAYVAVEKVNENGPQAPSLIDKLETMAERVRERAYEISQSRGTNGREMMRRATLIVQSPAFCWAIFTSAPFANESEGLTMTASELVRPETISTEFP